MTSQVLGRTNRAFPGVWLSLSAPHAPEDPHWAQTLAEAAAATGLPIDITSRPALWGGMLRGFQGTMTFAGGEEVGFANGARHASELVQAKLIQVLSALGREQIDIFFLRVDRALEEAQINGALEALETAKQDGLVGHIGLCAEGPALAVLGLWQFHDGFEAALIPHNPIETEAYDVLAPLAEQRRVGIVTYRPLNWGLGAPFTVLPSVWKLRNLTQSKYGLSIGQVALAHSAARHPTMVGVRTPEEVAAAVQAMHAPLPDGVNAMLAEFAKAYAGQADWLELKDDPRPWVAAAAARRIR